MTYVPALDGIRTIAVLIVVVFHAGAPWMGGGFVGVDVFFVLSGYLITTILAAEHERPGGIRLLRFYGRRATRLYPTLLLMLGAFVALAPTLWPNVPAWRWAGFAAIYITDYTRPLLGEPSILLSHTWSLSVEEHFYLLWPLALPAVLRSGNPVRTMLIAYVIATAWRVANVNMLGWELTYFRFDTRMSGLILGCLLAVMPRPTIPRSVSCAALLGILALATWPTSYLDVGLTLVPVLTELAAAVVVLGAAAPDRKPFLIAHPAMAYVGRLSYGIYLWHFPVVYWLRDFYPWPVVLAAGGVFSITAAAITYHGVDVPLRKLRSRMDLRRVRQSASA